ncbi:MAG: DUF115 domain-containing protein [Spirochaetaceae bacterium]|jgi:hypothetical protein|nr:DUF115 domain-containing protein [Spirochaetaceae bacterium]
MHKNVYIKNVQALREIFKIPQSVLEDGEKENNLEIKDTPSGFPSLSVNGRFIHSSRDPAKEANRLVEAAIENSNGENFFFVLLGFGLGYAAKAAATAKPGCTLLIIEKRPSVFRAALEQADWSEFFKQNRVILMLGPRPEAVFTALNAASAGGNGGGDFCKKAVVVKNRVQTALDEDFYSDVEKNIAVWRNKNAVNLATAAKFSKRWTRNLQANMNAFQNVAGVDRFFDVLTKENGGAFPILLLAAGPSLDKIAPYMSELQKRFIITAVDTASAFLRRAGVESDFLVSADPQYWNSRHLDNALNSKKTAYIFDLAVYPTVLRPFLQKNSLARVFCYSSNIPQAAALEERFGKKGVLAAGGSVATTAWDFCRRLQESLDARASILFICALDLAYPSLKTHYKGSFFEERSHCASNRLYPASFAYFRAMHALPVFLADGAAGAQVYTDARLNLYAGWFEDAMRRNQRVKCGGLFMQGLLIKGLNPVSLEEALAKPVLRPQIDDFLDGAFKKIKCEK